MIEAEEALILFSHATPTDQSICQEFVLNVDNRSLLYRLQLRPKIQHRG
jgi:hypothetical protein